MQSVNKDKIARLAALTLILSYVELIIPRVIPFFRLGLGNAALLSGLSSGLTFPAFMLLSLVKSVAANLMAGTLFSPFFIVSLCQSLSSAFVMFFLYKLSRCGKNPGRFFGIYGVSLAGSAVSAFVQIFLSSLYLGQGTFSLLGPMLLFNIISGLITAAIAENYMPKAFEAAYLAGIKEHTYSNATQNTTGKIIFLIALLTASASVFFIKNLYILLAFLIISLTAQKISKRKILIIPHISLWIFVIASSLLVPEGRILFSILNLSITQNALISGIQKALRLSAVSAFSQCAICIRPKENSLLALTLDYYKEISDSLRNTKLGKKFIK